MDSPGEVQRSVPIGSIDLAGSLGPLLMIPGDPTVRLGNGRFERATQTPDGPASIRLDWPTGSADHPEPTGSLGRRQVGISTWGPGGGWLLDRVEGLVGLADDSSGFDPEHKPLRDVWRRHQNRRLIRTGTLWHDLLWTIVQQRVTRVDASEQWKRLVAALGSPAPGPVDLMLPPEPGVVGARHYTEFHRFGIERKRAEYLRGAARLGERLASAVDEPLESVRPKLESAPGIGPWTVSSLATFTWGEADAVIVGDDGIPSMVTWLLAGEPKGDDRRMLELLEPYRPHRGRVIQLVFAAGVRPPRRHHRYARNPIRNR